MVGNAAWRWELIGAISAGYLKGPDDKSHRIYVLGFCIQRLDSGIDCFL